MTDFPLKMMQRRDFSFWINRPNVILINEYLIYIYLYLVKLELIDEMEELMISLLEYGKIIIIALDFKYYITLICTSIKRNKI